MVVVRQFALTITLLMIMPLTLIGSVAWSAVKGDEIVKVSRSTPNTECQECHGEKGFATPTGEFGESRKRKLFVDPDELDSSVHAKEKCVTCHNTIKQTPHKKERHGSVDCIQCHSEQVIKSKTSKTKTQTDITRIMVGLPPTQSVARIQPKKVAAETSLYLDSVHARSNKKNPLKKNASCSDCHGKHNVVPMKGKTGESFRLASPEICGRCHEKQLRQYTNSVHGAAVKRFGKLDAAVCSDCHNPHKITSPEDDPVKLAITEKCGSCHEKQFKSYRSTYHGQVARLGYTHTAKCHDCHNAHKTLPAKNPLARINKRNRLKACKECHKNATAGFITFEPHGNTHDRERFPVMWYVSKFMIVLLTGVFIFFWGHSLLWFYRELKEHKTGQAAIHVNQRGELKSTQHVRRFSKNWRQVHLLLALVVMTLALTGTTLLYADSFWAPVMIKLLGGPQIAGIIHRVAATTFGLLFFGHIAVILSKQVVKRLDSFAWFGPDSLLPRLQDWHDFVAMMKWFFGKGPRPVFDRWTYWEKFDYWAPFWGMFIIGVSGIMLWFPEAFATYLPGWVFNIATIVHGEEAFLAIVFLFTVHFFNSHFRPEKFPLDIVMFTGTVPLDEFREERPLEYERLVKSGQLEDFLVQAPTARQVKNSRILGFSLIIMGLGLLLLVLTGFIQGLVS